jgi:hypothetical protein
MDPRALLGKDSTPGLHPRLLILFLKEYSSSSQRFAREIPLRIN